MPPYVRPTLLRQSALSKRQLSVRGCPMRQRYVFAAPASHCANLPWTWPAPLWTATGTPEEIMRQALEATALGTEPQRPTPVSHDALPHEIARVLGVHPRRIHIDDAPAEVCTPAESPGTEAGLGQRG